MVVVVVALGVNRINLGEAATRHASRINLRASVVVVAKSDVAWACSFFLVNKDLSLVAF